MLSSALLYSKLIILQTTRQASLTKHLMIMGRKTEDIYWYNARVRVHVCVRVCACVYIYGDLSV